MTKSKYDLEKPAFIKIPRKQFLFFTEWVGRGNEAEKIREEIEWTINWARDLNIPRREREARERQAKCKREARE